MTYFYTYKITFVDGFYYFGSRLSKVKPEDDVYWGSPKTHKDKWKTTMFSKEILNVFEDGFQMMSEETKLILPVYRTDPFCLNRNVGGTVYFSQTVRNKLSVAAKGRALTKEHRQKISESLKLIPPEKNGFYGKTHSQESNQKRKETLKEIGHQQGSKNSQFGKMWITNGSHSYRINKNDSIPEGYRKGRVLLPKGN